MTLTSTQAELARLEARIDAHRDELGKEHDTARRRRLRAALASHEAERTALIRTPNRATA